MSTVMGKEPEDELVDVDDVEVELVADKVEVDVDEVV
jgi:hypothetical protein